jgi:hypothetical protein
MRDLLIPLTLLISIATTTGCGGGGGSSTSLVPSVTPDPVAPVITLNGEDRIQLIEGEAFTDPGASAFDNVDGSVTVSVSGEVRTAPGTYILTYTASDVAGNQSGVSREVIVVASDTTPPVITLNGSSSIEIEEGSIFNDPGAITTGRSFESITFDSRQTRLGRDVPDGCASKRAHPSTHT